MRGLRKLAQRDRTERHYCRSDVLQKKWLEEEEGGESGKRKRREV